MSEKIKEESQEQPEYPKKTKDKSSKFDLSKPIMTKRRFIRLNKEMEALGAEADKNLKPQKTSNHLKTINHICMVFLLLGISFLMQGITSSLFTTGLQISIGSIVIMFLISVCLKPAD
jgi:hypothetical protein